MIQRKQKLLLLTLLPLLGLLGLFWFWGADERALQRAQTEELKRVQRIELARENIKQALGPDISHNLLKPNALMNWDGKRQTLKVKYTIDEDIQDEAEKLLRAYKPDYGAVVVMDAVTGAVRAMASFEKGQPSTENLALRGTYPAASIFKIVTATAAID